MKGKMNFFTIKERKQSDQHLSVPASEVLEIIIRYHNNAFCTVLWSENLEIN